MPPKEIIENKSNNRKSNFAINQILPEYKNSENENNKLKNLKFNENSFFIENI